MLGAGESGVGSAILAQKKGFDIFVSDMSEIKPKYALELEQRGIEFEQKHHSVDRILEADLIIKSPGIPEKAPIIKSLRERNISIISEIEFASRYTDAKTICITGSNGKTTTTMLTYFILSQAGYNVGLAGNVGKSFAWQVAEKELDYYVIELSSFQLDGMYEFKADVAMLLNITPDHLDRYEYKFQNYIDSKFRILQNMTADESFIYWSNDPVIKAELDKRCVEATKCGFALDRQPNNMAWLNDNKLEVSYNGKSISVDIDNIQLRGTHNMFNSMAASIAALAVGVDPQVLSHALCAFQGVEHRLEYVASVDGVRYVNDSKATNVNSCWYALQSMTTPVVLILGGTDKGNDYGEIRDLVCNKVHSLVFMGVDNKKLCDYFSVNSKCSIYDTHSLDDAMRAARGAAKTGDTVLLSPCCASFDLFKSYEDRGDQFKEMVRNFK